MTSRSIMENMFRDDPFFHDDFLLWEGRGGFREHFLQRRAHFLERFDLDGLLGDLLQDLDGFSSSPWSSRLSQTEPEEELLEDPAALPGAQEDDPPSLQGLDDIVIPPASPPSSTILSVKTCGACPDDVTVTLTGRTLEVRVAELPAPGCGASAAAAASVRRVELPDRVHPSTLTCTLGVDGVLRVGTDRPETSEGEEQLVPIRFRTALDFTMNQDD